MVQSERFLSLIEKDQRSSVLEFKRAERTRKSKKEHIHEKVTFLRIGALPTDELVSFLRDLVERAAGLFHYKLGVLFAYHKPMM